MPNEGLMTTAAVAELLDVSSETVLRWHHAKKIPGGARLPDGALRFRRKVLEDWIDDGGCQRDASDDAPMTNSLHAVGAAR